MATWIWECGTLQVDWNGLSVFIERSVCAFFAVQFAWPARRALANRCAVWDVSARIEEVLLALYSRNCEKR